MKRIGGLLAVALVAASILSGCIIVPAEEYYGGGRHNHRHRGGHSREWDRRGW